MRAIMALASALALGWAGVAQAACIEPPVANAARLHEFEMMMMDVSLRCTRMGVAMRPNYEEMVSAHQHVFDGAAQTLKTFFDRTADTHHGSVYERYTTLIANHYGAGNTSLEACKVFDAVVGEVAHTADGGKVLGAVAMTMIPHPMLERETCLAAR